MLYYLTHPEVDIDPAVPVPDWSLSDKGRARVRALAAAGWPRGPARILSSPERKARETAEILAAPIGAPVQVVPHSGEIDRRSTGYVPHDRHEALANALFAHPDQSAEGWETARAAQARIVAALSPWFSHVADQDVVIVGHGGVGTLLWCHIANQPISRSADQPGVGHVWSARSAGDRLLPVSAWHRLETLLHGDGLDAPHRP
jgi:broad specificity phosphatase PhoE